jgi:uncharacterized membrane protein
MRSCGLRFSLSLAVLLLGCDTRKTLEPSSLPVAPSMAKGGGSSGDDFATLSKLPALHRRLHGEAYAVDQAGSLIAGFSWDQDGRMNPVTWTLQNGAWTVTKLPVAASATGGEARAVNDDRYVAGNDFAATSPHAVLWPSTGGFSVLGCGEPGEAYGISAGAQIVVGVDRRTAPVTAAVWRPGSCREELPPLIAGGRARAAAVSGNGTIVGGSAAVDAVGWVPVRWTRVGDTWLIEQLDSRAGEVNGANSTGDLVGRVQVPCAPGSCSRGVIWYAAGGSREFGAPGGETTIPRAINAAGEVAGLVVLPNGDGYPFIWSEAQGMRRLPVAYNAAASAISGVRSDGTRLVVGAGGRPFSALAWVVRNP